MINTSLDGQELKRLFTEWVEATYGEQATLYVQFTIYSGDSELKLEDVGLRIYVPTQAPRRAGFSEDSR